MTDDDEDRAKRSANSTLNQARAVFTEAALQLYRDKELKVPSDLREFREALLFKAGVKDTYNPASDELLARTFAALPELTKGDELHKNMYRAICLACGAGLRKSEVQRASWGWFTERNGQPWLQSSMITKNGDSLEVPILREWWDRLQVLKPEVGPKTILTDVREEVFREIGKWMGALGWTTQKRLHEFRAYVGCKVAEAHGIEAASLFLRHGCIATTQRFYGRYLKLRKIEVSLEPETEEPAEKPAVRSEKIVDLSPVPAAASPAAAAH